MDPAVSTDRDLATSYRSDRDGTACLAVDAQRGRKLRIGSAAVDIEEIAAIRLALEIKQMNCTRRIDDGLRLDAAIRGRENGHASRPRARTLWLSREGEIRQKEREQNR